MPTSRPLATLPLADTGSDVPAGLHDQPAPGSVTRPAHLYAHRHAHPHTFEPRETGPAFADRTRDDSAQIRAEIAMKRAFLAAARRGDLLGLADFAPRGTIGARGTRALPRPTVAEALADALGYETGPSLADACRVLALCARAGNIDAQELLGRMADTYAAQKAEADE